MATDLPATSEVLLPTDASKHILDTFLGQGWDSWGASLGGSQASELMLEMFSAFNLIALAVVSLFSDSFTVILFSFLMFELS